MSDGAPEWKRVDALLEKALDLPPGERAPFVKRAAADDPSLRDEVLALLGTEEKARSFLEEGGPPVSRDILEHLAKDPLSPEVPGPGDRVGRYLLLELIGRGGMSLVYRARRDDGAFEQEVAVKLLPAFGPPDDLAARLRAERQILASLSHPGIARVFDGGRTLDGRPYLVVELVEGVPLDRHVETRRPGLDERLDLFGQVARAVQYAHRNLVVHRDLKPANILITGEGRVKLLDFGIARILEGPGGAADVTVDGSRWMTPRYAAPEQILGRPVTTATDVHSLGVLLYELLTGTVPFGGEDSTRFEIERAVCETEPRPPSHVAGPGTRPPSRVLGRDLDAIVLKALRKEPEERYESVALMLEDLERYRGGFPVSAREGTVAYRTRKFVRRHRAGVAVAAVFALTLTGGAAALALQQAETARQRDRASEAAAVARQRAEDAEAAIAFLADVFKGGDPNQAAGDTLTALGLVEWAERRVHDELDDRPEVKAELLAVLGDAYQNLGFGSRGEPLLREAVDLTRSNHGDRSVETAAALLRLSRQRGVDRDHRDALIAAAEALQILDASPSPPVGLLSRALQSTSLALRDLELPDSAARFLERAVALEREAGLQESEAHLQTLMSLAYVRRAQGRLDEAVEVYREGIRRYRTLHPDPTSELARHLNNLAFTLRSQERWSEAEPLFREALAIQAEIYGRGHPLTLNTAYSLAALLELTERAQEADSLTSANVRAARAQWSGDHYQVASALSILGNLRLRAGDPAGAEGPLLESAAMNRRLLGTDHYLVLFDQAELGALRILQGRDAQGRTALDGLYDRLVAWSESGGGVHRWETRNALRPLIYTLDGAGLEEEARRFGALLERYPPQGA